MRLAVVIDREHVRHWHMRFVDDLRADGHEVIVAAANGVRRRQSDGFDRMFERRLYRIPHDHPTALIRPMHRTPVIDIDQCPVVDLTVDLAGSSAMIPVIAPVFEGSRDEECAAAAIIGGRSPGIGVVYRATPPAVERLVAVGSPAITDRDVLVRALDQYSHGAVRMLRQTIKRIALGQALPTLTQEDDGIHGPCRRPASFAAKSLSGKLVARLRRMAHGREHWRIGIRRVAGDAVRDTLVWPEAPYRFLPDDDRRYYADPFIFVHAGTAYVFCEEYPYATGKGIISHFTLAPDGSPSSPRPVLERPYHLSYPYVFAHGGEIWMMPETTGNRTVELFRAVRFPEKWEKVGDLIAGVSAADATLVEHDGRHWLFAAIADDGGSDRDALGLFYADDVMGPWTPHPLNPVLLDVRSARPGGHMYRRNGRLLRPAQDCRDGYGAGLTICEILRLDIEGYEQHVVSRLGPQRRWHAHGAHTLNEAGGFEAIDCLGRLKRFPG